MLNNGVVTTIDASSSGLKKIASGKVREIFEIDDDTLLFVATDRISAYDVILDNVRPPCSLRRAHIRPVLTVVVGHPSERRPSHSTVCPLVLADQL